MSTAEKKNELTYAVLSDINGAVAKQFGLVFQMNENLREMYAAAGIDVPAPNGNDTFELPVPGTFVIDTQGTIVLAFANVDYKQRLEPDAIVEALQITCLIGIKDSTFIPMRLCFPSALSDDNASLRVIFKR